MRDAQREGAGHNVQTVVDAEHALIVTQQVSDETTDNSSLQLMAEWPRKPRWPSSGRLIHVVADAGLPNGEQAEACEKRGSFLMCRQFVRTT